MRGEGTGQEEEEGGEQDNEFDGTCCRFISSEPNMG